MNNYQNERMKLWREVYVFMLSEHARAAQEMADIAVNQFDKQFRTDSPEVLPEQAG